MLNTEADPRVYFAAERTLLAWIRTGMTIMAFGFVVARFGLFLRLLRAEERRRRSRPAGSRPISAPRWWSSASSPSRPEPSGTGSSAAFWVRSRKPSPHAEILPLVLGWSLAVLGVVLVAVLLA